MDAPTLPLTSLVAPCGCSLLRAPLEVFRGPKKTDTAFSRRLLYRPLTCQVRIPREALKERVSPDTGGMFPLSTAAPPLHDNTSKTQASLSFTSKETKKLW